MSRLTQRFLNFRGVNRSLSQEATGPSTLREAWNCRQGPYGAVEKRQGTAKASDAVVPDDGSGYTGLTGVFLWQEDTNNYRILAKRGTSLYEQAAAASVFTVAPSGTGLWSSDTDTVGFVPWDTGASAAVYMTDPSGAIKKYDGTTISSLSGGPSNTTSIDVYQSRMFAAVKDSSTIYWCKVNDPSKWASTDGGGQAPVSVVDNTPILALKAVGNALLVFKENSVARFSGTDPANIRIDQDAQGLSRDVGLAGDRTLVAFDSFVFFLSEKGPYIASEAGLEYIGEPVEHWMQKVNWSQRDKFHACHNRTRGEIILYVSPQANETLSYGGRWGWRYSAGNSSLYPVVGLVYNYKSGTWWGPWVLGGSDEVYDPDSAGIPAITCSTGSYQRQDNLSAAKGEREESFLIGTSDGWVVDGDSFAGYQDLMDRGSSFSQQHGTGTDYHAVIELPELHFGDQGRFKSLSATQRVIADVDVTAQTTDAIQVKTWSESCAEKTLDITVNTAAEAAFAGNRSETYEFRPAARGFAPVMQVHLKGRYAALSEVRLTAEMGRVE